MLDNGKVQLVPRIYVCVDIEDPIKFTNYKETDECFLKKIVRRFCDPILVLHLVNAG